jgi:hypothetical protein
MLEIAMIIAGPLSSLIEQVLDGWIKLPQHFVSVVHTAIHSNYSTNYVIHHCIPLLIVSQPGGSVKRIKIQHVMKKKLILVTNGTLFLSDPQYSSLKFIF